MTALYLCYPIMQPSYKRPVSNTLVFSSIVFSFALCLVALVHVEFELYAHQRMRANRVEAFHQRIKHSNKLHRRINNWEVFLFGSG